MGEKAELCKVLMKKATIVFDNIGETEQEEVRRYLDILEMESQDNKLLFDDSSSCKCENKNNIIKIGEKTYCVNCLRFIEETIVI